MRRERLKVVTLILIGAMAIGGLFLLQRSSWDWTPYTRLIMLLAVVLIWYVAWYL